MRRISTTCIVFFALVFPIGLFAKQKKDDSATVVCPGKWIICNSVKKLYDTPLGAVYDFTKSPFFNFLSVHTKDNMNATIHSLQLNIAGCIGNGKNLRDYRYIVLDFKIRTFPAKDDSREPGLRFTLTRSGADGFAVNRYRDLNGVSLFRSKDYAWTPMTLGWNSNCGDWRNHVHNKLMVYAGSNYQPYYDIIAFRVIFDTVSKGISSTNVNGARKVVKDTEEYYEGKNVYGSLGVCVQLNEGLVEKTSIRTILEISDPTLTLVRLEDDLATLPEVKPSHYPYEGYSEDGKNIKKNRNPDAVYAYAMRSLEEGNFPEAIKWLKNAAQNKHIFAMYQLGVCYYRGYGVEPDLKSAFSWLEKAMRYDHPDAIALHGRLTLDANKPLLNNPQQDRLKQALNLERFTWKHDNMVLGMSLNATYPFFANPDGKMSHKLSAWCMFNMYSPLYYRFNRTSPERKINAPPPADKRKAAEKFSGPITQLPPLHPPKKEPNPQEHVFGYDKASRAPTLNYKYHDKRYSNPLPLLLDNGFDYYTTDEQIAAGFTPAMLYKGRLMLNSYGKVQVMLKFPPMSLPVAKDKAEATRRALAWFEQGAKRGNRQCELEAMYCRATSGTLKPTNFTPQTDMRLGDYPLYYLLRYAVENPSRPGIREFLERDFPQARKIWSAHPTPENRFLLGAEGLYQFYDYGFDSFYSRIFYDDVQDLCKANAQIDKAASEGVAAAQYLAGQALLDGQRARKMELSNGPNYLQVKEAMRLLNLAAKNGHLKAQYLLVKQDFSSKKTVDDTWLEKLEPARAAQSDEAWFLTGEILSRQVLTDSSIEGKMLEAYGKAAGLGHTLALSRLGAYYYRQKDEDKAKKYWREFLRRDRELRNQDPLDIYADNVKPLNTKALRDGMYSGVGGMNLPRNAKKYVNTY